MIRFEAPIPTLRIFSVEKAKEFYAGFLGFTVDWEHRFEWAAPVFMQVSRAGVRFFLSEHHGDACPGSAVTVPMTGLDAYLAELTAKNYGYYKPGIEDTPWNTREMRVIDPFGNRINFSETKPSPPS